MGTKNDPGKFDCYHKAEDDEPMFVLLARDIHAPSAVYDWINSYELACEENGGPTPEQAAKIDEAVKCAEAMEFWRMENRD